MSELEERIAALDDDSEGVWLADRLRVVFALMVERLHRIEAQALTVSDRELIHALVEATGCCEAHIEALEKRLYKLEDVVREILLSRTRLN